MHQLNDRLPGALIHITEILQAGNTKGGSITVQLTSCLDWFG